MKGWLVVEPKDLEQAGEEGAEGGEGDSHPGLRGQEDSGGGEAQSVGRMNTSRTRRRSLWRPDAFSLPEASRVFTPPSLVSFTVFLAIPVF